MIEDIQALASLYMHVHTGTHVHTCIRMYTQSEGSGLYQIKSDL